MTVAARVVVTQSLAGPSVEARLRGAGIRALCPMYSREVTHARRTERKMYPLFATYMFAWVEDDALRSVLSVRGAVDVLRKAGDHRALAIVPDVLISALSCEAAPLIFECGERVEVSHGRWEGFKGLYHSSHNERVKLLFQMLGRECVMEFPLSQIRKIRPALDVKGL